MPAFPPPAFSGELAIVTTYKCQARCAHCMMESKPERAEMLSYRWIAQMVEAWNAVAPLQLVVFTGGEATLLGEDLLDSIAHVASMGIMTRLVTNASWATSSRTAPEAVASFRECGLNEINFSFDEFHRPFVSDEQIRLAWDACQGAGFLSVIAAICEPEGSDFSSKFRSLVGQPTLPSTRRLAGGRSEIPGPSSDGTRYLMSPTGLSKLGRAAKLPSGLFLAETPKEKTEGSCPSVLNPVTVFPNRHVGLCCGCNLRPESLLDLGQLSEAPSTEEVQRLLECAAADPVLRLLSALGPAAMARFFSPDMNIGGYKGVCELCNALCQDETKSERIRNAAADMVRGCDDQFDH